MYRKYGEWPTDQLVDEFKLWHENRRLEYEISSGVMANAGRIPEAMAQAQEMNQEIALKYGQRLATLKYILESDRKIDTRALL